MISYDHLLSRLDNDPQRAADAYDLLRRKLVMFFLNGCQFPQDLADEVLNRAARRSAEGVEIKNLSAYCFSVAQNVRYEQWYENEKARRNQAAMQQQMQSRAPTTPEQQLLDKEQAERRSICLRECLRRLPEDERKLFLAYQREDHHQAARRRELAGQWAISPVGLRTRVHRLRLRIEGCAQACLNGARKAGGKI